MGSIIFVASIAIRFSTRRIWNWSLSKTTSRNNLAGVLHQERQKAVLQAIQPNRLTVEHHYLLVQMHEQVGITIELLVRRRENRLLTEGDAIFHSASL